MQSPNPPTTQTAPNQWAIIELMGHVRTAGRVSKDTEFNTPLIRLDVPVKGKDTEFVTQYINSSSLYRMTMCEEKIARAFAEQSAPPVEIWQVKHLLLPNSDPSDPSDPSDEDTDDDIPL